MRKARKKRVAGEIMAGMREIERMIDRRQCPQELFKVGVVEVSKPDRPSGHTNATQDTRRRKH